MVDGFAYLRAHLSEHASEIGCLFGCEYALLGKVCQSTGNVVVQRTGGVGACIGECRLLVFAE